VESTSDRNRITWTGPLNGLAAELAACDVAVVGGGVSLYEACARGVAAVGVPVVVPQRPTVRGFVLAGAARGDASRAPDVERVARDVVQLLRSQSLRNALVGQGRKLVDGRGAERVADAIRHAIGRPKGLQPRTAAPRTAAPRTTARSGRPSTSAKATADRSGLPARRVS
jgi:hypothetical protein